jgi:EAL domain-containing protein (putative c-di-GMP-specific phosphodiesterase class I)
MAKSASETGAVERLRVSMGLRGALRRGHLVLHYQPKVELTSGRVVSAEALVRWRHPRHGLVAPADFLPKIEGSRLMRELSEEVVARAARDASEWQSRGNQLRVAVNVSPDSLTPDFSRAVERALSASSLPAEMLRIELTELPGATGGIEPYVEALDRLHILGVTISLDDFGQGESSLARLASLPVDALKIDQSFIQAMNHDSKSAAVVWTAIQLGHRFGMTVIAEGVETEEQWHRLRAWNCDLAQGHLISRAVPSHDLMAWLAGDDPPRLMLMAAEHSPDEVERRTGAGDRRSGALDRRQRRGWVH